MSDVDMTPTDRRRLPIPLRTSADTTGEVQRVLGTLEARGQNLAVMRLLANSSATFRASTLMAGGLLDRSPLPAIDREVAVLRASASARAPYVWEQHVGIARGAGVTSEQIEQLRSWSDDYMQSFTASQQLAIGVVDEILEGELSDETWRSACATWGPEAAIDMIIAVAWWGGFLAVVLRAVGLETDTIR